MTTAEKILTKKGPLLSSTLVSLIEKQEKIGKNTASQKLTRDNSINKIKGFYTSGQSLKSFQRQWKRMEKNIGIV